MGVLAALAGSGGSSGGGGAAIGSLFFLLIYVAIIIIYVVGLWKTFEKAGQKGWLAIIPILNLYVLVKLAGREGWWVILYLIPCVGIIVHAIVSIDVAKGFGKTEGYGIGLWLLPFIFYPMLGFSAESRYQGPQTTPVI